MVAKSSLLFAKNRCRINEDCKTAIKAPQMYSFRFWVAVITLKLHFQLKSFRP